ncbi:hypothetical protein PR048_024407 [Dryococelus australis]|uniref:Uncharacterized protein n=1 Tax=Dryococelus australis TaxID=614101 RepID=A0ABQ9GNI7_9NEOP|nr:hypothetical protein PR048_024407 [Dryococelus australis]
MSQWMLDDKARPVSHHTVAPGKLTVIASRRPQRVAAPGNHSNTRPIPRLGPRWLRGYPTRLPPRRSGFNPRPGHSGFSHVGIVPGRCFLGDLPFRPPSHSGAAPYSPQSPSSALKTSMLRAVQISSLTHTPPPQPLAANQRTGKSTSKGIPRHFTSVYPIPEDRTHKELWSLARRMNPRNFRVPSHVLTEINDRVDELARGFVLTVPGPPESVRALSMTSESILVCWTSPAEPNGRIIKFYMYSHSQSSGAQVRPVSLRHDDISDSLDVIKAEVKHLPMEHCTRLYNVKNSLHSSTDTIEIVIQEVQKEGVEDGGLVYEARQLKEHETYEFWVTAVTSAGEGSSSSRVAQSPTSRVPARIATFAQQVVAAVGQRIALPCRAVGLPAPQRAWRGPGGGEVAAQHRLTSAHELLLTALRPADAGNYTCRAHNMFGWDEVSHIVVVAGPPGPTVLSVTASTSTSVTLVWRASSPSTPITEYALKYKCVNEAWKTMVIDNDLSSFLVKNLKCGSKHLFSMTALNSVGPGKPSPTISVPTKGDVPGVPYEDDLLVVNSTSATLFLQEWPDGGCPLHHFAVDYRLWEQRRWWSLRAEGHHEDMTVPDLTPATWYTLRVTAHNDAGSRQHEFVFATKTWTGEMVEPYVVPVLHEQQTDTGYHINVIVPVVSGAICTVAASFCACLLLHRRSALSPSSPLKVVLVLAFVYIKNLSQIEFANSSGKDKNLGNIELCILTMQWKGWNVSHFESKVAVMCRKASHAAERCSSSEPHSLAEMENQRNLKQQGRECSHSGLIYLSSPTKQVRRKGSTVSDPPSRARGVDTGLIPPLPGTGQVSRGVHCPSSSLPCPVVSAWGESVVNGDGFVGAAAHEYEVDAYATFSLPCKSGDHVTERAGDQAMDYCLQFQTFSQQECYAGQGAPASANHGTQGRPPKYLRTPDRMGSVICLLSSRAIKSHSYVSSFTVHLHGGNTTRLARKSDEALGVRVSVARIAPSLLDLECAGGEVTYGRASSKPAGQRHTRKFLGERQVV